ncbi:hypothetical protein Rhe02_33090 [Rhizocola hellebori]|uniref:DUF1330 domain-containing protein n=1 Tax=Rhizocola hellebori TaxID=1392758 RepID=A0A8J3Q8N1_9ACTN|nr:DUF1330 domain-containing protein [Rhizocola hellebori]GIH05242.1 hypothetical protein Rhe02_33090 [Rhizocola hellebori]
MAINPSGSELADFVDADPGAPVVMLNLLRFAEGGRESYARYAEALQDGILARHGARVLYAGDGQDALVAEPGQAWDAVLLVHYPSRQAFGQMVADAEYHKVAHLRAQSLSEAVLQPTRAWGR